MEEKISKNINLLLCFSRKDGPLLSTSELPPKIFLKIILRETAPKGKVMTRRVCVFGVRGVG